jgi:predicted GNAT family acetyltransferase
VRLRPIRIVPVGPTADDAAVARVLEVARRAFGVAPITATPMDVAEQRAALAAGRYRSVLAEVNGAIAGVGSMSVPNDELVGIGTLAAFRRKGVATVVSRHLVAEHLATGRPAVWLAAGDAIAEAVYAAIGFQRAGVQLDYSDPDPA